LSVQFGMLALTTVLGASSFAPSMRHPLVWPDDKSTGSNYPSARVASSPIMRYHRHEVSFSLVTDREFCTFKIREIAKAICSWTAEDWAYINVPPAIMKLDASASEQIGGVVVDFVGWGGQGRDGSLSIVLEAKPSAFSAYNMQLVWTTMGSRREEAENLIYKLVLEEVRVGALRNVW